MRYAMTILQAGRARPVHPGVIKTLAIPKISPLQAFKASTHCNGTTRSAIAIDTKPTARDGREEEAKEKEKEKEIEKRVRKSIFRSALLAARNKSGPDDNDNKAGHADPHPDTDSHSDSHPGSNEHKPWIHNDKVAFLGEICFAFFTLVAATGGTIWLDGYLGNQRSLDDEEGYKYYLSYYKG